ncbi:MAG: hypothetical protein ACYSSI_02255, partial [Planctomycetota bacterium]
MGNGNNNDTVFGEMAVELGLCTDDELNNAIDQFKTEGEDGSVSLEDVMISCGYITYTQAERLKTSISETKAAAQQIPGY